MKHVLTREQTIFRSLSSTVVRFFCVLIVFCFAATFQHNSLALDYSGFVALPLSEQRAVVAERFATWLEVTQNMRYTNTETVTFSNTNRDFQGSNPQFRAIHHHWLYGDAYRMATQILDPDGSSRVVQDYQSAFNKRSGEMRGTYSGFPIGIAGTLFGRIDTVQDQTVMDNSFWTWLTDGFVSNETRHVLFDDAYLFPFLLRRQNSWEFVLLDEERHVALFVPFESEFPFQGDTRQVGHKTLILDPQRNFMPVQIDAHWEELPEPPGHMFKTERYIIEESAKFGSIWVPTTLRYELLASSSLEGLEQVNVHTLRITNVEFGTVEQSDVEIIFPAGTEVVNAVEGVFYTTDARGEPIPSTIEYLYGLDPSHPSMQLPEPPSRGINIALIVIGIVLIAIGLYIHFRKRYAT